MKKQNTIRAVVIYYEQQGKRTYIADFVIRTYDRKALPSIYIGDSAEAHLWATEMAAQKFIASLFNPHYRDFKTETIQVPANAFDMPAFSHAAQEARIQ